MTSLPRMLATKEERAAVHGTAPRLTMFNPFFDHPILNSPYECPARHWELDPDGQPTQKVLPRRRAAEFITPVPKPKKRKKADIQAALEFDEGLDLSTKAQQYDVTSIINQVRQSVDTWRALPKPRPVAGDARDPAAVANLAP